MIPTPMLAPRKYNDQAGSVASDTEKDLTGTAFSPPAVDGKATEAVRRALAEALGVKTAAVTLRVGATSRDKVFLVETRDAEVIGRLAGLRDGPGERR